MPDSLCIFQQQDMMIAYLRLDGPTRWHTSISEGSILSPISSKNLVQFSSNELSVTLYGMPRHSRSEYCSLLQDFRSVWTIWLCKTLICFMTANSASNLETFSLNSERSFFNTSQILITFILIIKSKFNNLFHGKLFMSRLFYAISIKKQACVTY